MVEVQIKPKRLVAGIGVNDADYLVYPRLDGKSVMCPFYRAWTAMLSRCYSKLTQERQPTYIGCSVSEEWLRFSSFRAWMETQDWQGKQLDKDILVPGNKIYSAETCVFVSSEVNSLMIDCSATRGDLPLGVCLGRSGKVTASIRSHGKRVHLGSFDTPSKAYKAYVKAKSAHIRQLAGTQSERVQSALNHHADILEKTTASHC